MKYSDSELNDFEKNVLRATWDFQKSTGKVNGPYPENKPASEVHKILFGGPPISFIRREMLKEIDSRIKKKPRGQKDFTVTFIHGPNKYVYKITDTTGADQARSIGIGKYISENRYGHNSPKLVNKLVADGLIKIEISPAH